MGLEEYNKKRDFSQTSEPAGKAETHKGKLKFVVQRHDASKLHYDFRLEMEGVLKSWAVPKGPSMNPADKRLAVEVEDHPFSYRTFEGDIPAGNYGAGHVDIWDEGTFTSAETDDRKKDEEYLLRGLKEGSVKFRLHGKKLRGEFNLIKMKGRQEDAWLLVKKSDEEAVSDHYDAEDYFNGKQTKSSGSASKTKAKANSKTTKKTIAKSGKTASKTVANPIKKSGTKNEMPHLIKPMMAKLTDGPFDGEDWIFEIKWDGFRAVAEVQDGKVELYSRSGKSYGNTYQPILDSLQQLGHDVILDGEIVVLNEKGYATFQQLQNYQNTPSEYLYFYVFDILFLDGEDLRGLPLIERKQRLEEMLPELPAVRYSDHVIAKGKAFFKEAQKNQVEGIMGKLASSPYRTGARSSEWLKIKTHLRQEAVIGGFTAPKGKRKHIGALLLGVYENGKFLYVGQAGSGFNTKILEALKSRLDKLVQPETAFENKVKSRGEITWVKPELVAEITFAEWTDEGIMRQAIYEGLRDDKKAQEIVRENAVQTSAAVKEAEKGSLKSGKKSAGKTVSKASKNENAGLKAVEEMNSKSGKTSDAKTVSKSGKKAADTDNVMNIEGQEVPVTNLDKLYWPEEGITKGDLINYYQSVAEVMMPYLKDRPQSLLRHPNGIEKPGFFQKDIPNAPDWIRTETLPAESTGKDVEYLVCDNKATLAYMNNLGCIQLNPWNSRLANLETPDYLVIDLDPGENTYDEVVQVALELKKILDKAGADSYVKTSGATGMHIFVPMGAKYPFEQVRSFAHILAQLVHEQLPELTSLERSPKERRYQVYLDFLQNSIGQTIAAPYGVRPRPGATVSAPLLWEEVKPGLTPTAFTIKNMPQRLKKLGDIFRGVLGKGVDIEKCLKNLEK